MPCGPNVDGNRGSIRNMQHLLVGLLVAGDDARRLARARRRGQRIAEGPVVRRRVLGRVRHDGHAGEALAVQRIPAKTDLPQHSTLSTAESISVLMGMHAMMRTW